MNKKHFIFIFFLAISILSIAQSDFQLQNNLKKQRTSFKLIGNLIVLPIEVNGSKLNFILDSGVGTTVLFNIYPKDSVLLNNQKAVKLKGLGSEEPVDAILSENNIFRINNVVSANQKLYVIFNDFFNLSSKLGITIHGIIGYNLLKNFVVKINYATHKITFIKSESFKGCAKCEKLAINFFKKKPYINAKVQLTIKNNIVTPVKLLVDSGGSDALWLFENTHKNIVEPTNFFNDYLGEGLSGSVFGKRSKIETLFLGNYSIRKPTVSYPDSLSIVHALQYKARNGSLGASILKRFTVYFNYPNKQLLLRKNSLYKEPFRYNMSGIELVHNGKMLVKESKLSDFKIKNTGEASSNTVISFNYRYTFKPSYKVDRVIKDSPADQAGVLPGDILIKVNGKYAYNYPLEEIIHKFYQKEGTPISIVVERNGYDYLIQFKLKSRLK
ncbi:MAG: PDZ domain-containing protein [Lutibacter sp.]